MTNEHAFTRWFRAWMAEHRYSIRQVAALFAAHGGKISRSAVAAWKNGDFLPTARQVPVLAKISGASEEWLMEVLGFITPTETPGDVQEMIGLYTSLAPRWQRTLREIGHSFKVVSEQDNIPVHKSSQDERSED